MLRSHTHVVIFIASYNFFFWVLCSWIVNVDRNNLKNLVVISDTSTPSEIELQRWEKMCRTNLTAMVILIYKNLKITQNLCHSK